MAPPQNELALTSRVHPLRGFPGCHVLRDDELGGLFGGSKWRKYASLLPALARAPEVLLRGGPTSHNVLALALLLRERGIRPVYFWPVRGRAPGGVFALTREVLGDGLHAVEAAGCDAAIADYLRQHPTTLVVAEGASVVESLPGALSLARQVGAGDWARVFVDSGTGMMAAVLVLGQSIPVEVVDLTGGFEEALARWRPHTEKLLGRKLPGAPYRVHRPPVGRSFGSTPAAVRAEIGRLAREEGFLTDPVYSGKLFLTARTLATPGSLLIHSGGTLSLAYAGRNQLSTAAVGLST